MNKYKDAAHGKNKHEYILNTSTTDTIGIPPSITAKDNFIIHSPLKTLSPNTVPFFNLCNSPQRRKSSMLLSHQYQLYRQHSECSCPGIPGLTTSPLGNFGDLVDQSRIDELPPEEDLFMKFLDDGEAVRGHQHNAMSGGLLIGHDARQQQQRPDSAERFLVKQERNKNNSTLDHNSADMFVPIKDECDGGEVACKEQFFNVHGNCRQDQRLMLPPHLDLTQAGRRHRLLINPVRRKRRLSASLDTGSASDDEATASETTCNANDSDDDSFDATALLPRKKATAGKATKSNKKSTVAAGTQKKKNAPPSSVANGTTASPVVKQSFTGVSHHRLTQRWEASLWLRGRQLYLGGFDNQENAAHAYDLAALACKGPNATTNFPASDYKEQLKDVEGFSCEEVVAYVRRRSTAFSRGKSKYRGVSGHQGRWEARIGSFNGRKNVSFGIFETEEEAARQYDRALILEKGRSAKTNFPLRDYDAEVQVYKRYMATACGNLKGGPASKLKHIEAYTLPRGRVATADERKKSTIIYAESLRSALEKMC